jgi:PTS system fructose-specific IIC component/PTS system nitrogen regulatory IIA component
VKPRIREKQMFLYNVFPPEFIKIDLESKDKDEVFEELVDHYCHADKTDKRKSILDALWGREVKMSTGIQKGIAIPHGTTDAVETASGVLGISRKGIDYDSLDGDPVYLLFMLIAPQKDTETHMQMLRRLAALLENPQFYSELQSQKDPKSAHKIIRKYEEILIALD